MFLEQFLLSSFYLHCVNVVQTVIRKSHLERELKGDSSFVEPYVILWALDKRQKRNIKLKNGEELLFSWLCCMDQDKKRQGKKSRMCVCAWKKQQQKNVVGCFRCQTVNGVGRVGKGPTPFTKVDIHHLLLGSVGGRRREIGEGGGRGGVTYPCASRFFVIYPVC